MSGGMDRAVERESTELLLQEAERHIDYLIAKDGYINDKLHSRSSTRYYGT